MNTNLLAMCALLLCVILAATSPNPTFAESTVLQDDPYAARKIFYEERWQKKIEATLKYIEGAVVSVDVVLTTELDKSVKTEEFIGEPTAEIEVSELAITKLSGEDFEGLSSKELSRNSQDNGAESREEICYTKNRVPISHITTSITGLVPTSVSVSVSIPTSYYEAVLSHRKRRSSKEAGNSDVSNQLHSIERVVNSKIQGAIEILLPNRGHRDTFIKVTSFDNLTGTAIPPLSSYPERTFIKGDVLTVAFDSALLAKNSPLSKFFKAESIDSPVLRLAAEVKTVQPNGNLIIESQKSVASDGEKIKLTVKGIIRPDSFGPDGVTVSTDRISKLEVDVHHIEN